MPQLLVVESSPRGDRSVSRTMARAFVDRWQAAHPHGTMIVRDLAETTLPFVTASWLEAYLTPSEHQSPEMKAVLRRSDELGGELFAADHLVIATPVYNYNVPAVLKAWVDHVVRKGITLGPDGSGLLMGKKATVLLASGGFYGEGSPIRDRDIAGQYLRLILGVIGITDVTVVAAGNAKAVDLREQAMDEFIARIEPEIAQAAA